MNLAERLRARAEEVKATISPALQENDPDEYFRRIAYGINALWLADKRESRRIAAGDPVYVRP